MRLGDLVKLYKGRKPLEIVNEPIEGYRRSLQISDLRPGAKPRYCPADKKELLAVPNDVIIAWDGANAGTTSHGLKGSVGSTLMVLRIQQEELIDTAYLGHFIASKQSYLRAKTKGATIPHLDRVILESLDVPLPPLEEQKRIVAILDKAKSIQEAREHQLTTLDELLISFFKDSFHAEDYPHKPLKEIATVLSGGTPRSSVQEYWNGNIEWVTPADLGQHEGIYFSSSSRKITDTGLKNSSAVLLPIGSVMMSSRAPIGHLAINTVPMATNQGFKSIVPGEEITNLYLLFWLKSHMKYIQSLGVGATFKEISKRGVENIKVPVPPIRKQNRFSRKVSKIISQQTLIHKSLENDKSLFLSIQSRFFNY
ncbi:type I restriction modification DNA specificity domain protein [Rothia dentocariosa ATCC 17931]|uniref:Type I restriction modification DNA specificity domain protein n=1 Tax=Rothia dentocariosa (strain ATCC 17931 / CDC X599 / XDIA) TaxID=762948 RepID=E3H204_ROTDC|nr:restriction endonuclease subunit S [Rothia dentocariosa]ADP41314.1 type I restriction modification DNA specificity domain protein [Rothia dentocariosa ATCC 17931]WMS32051.1 restriction endonuclease subunit S [Rothia dentocariosa]SUE38890.1 EcoKI restriction-modification system protein HsdS [Rothia dentocariosa]